MSSPQWRGFPPMKKGYLSTSNLKGFVPMRESQLSPWEWRVFRVKICTLVAFSTINKCTRPLVNAT